MSEGYGKIGVRPSRVNSSSFSRSKSSPAKPESPSQAPSTPSRPKSSPSKSPPSLDIGLDSHFGLSANPLHLELRSLENKLKVKDLEIEGLVVENKSLKQLTNGKDKAISSLQSEIEKLREKQEATEKLLADKLLELKTANDQKRAAFSSQAAAEATKRRLQLSLKDEPKSDQDAVVAAMESELKMANREIQRLSEDNRAKERNVRSKEAALLNTEREMENQREKAAQVEALQNINKKLQRQIELSQEESRTLDRLYKQKVDEVHRLSEQITSLQEMLTAAGGAASTIKDYQKQIQELQSELRITQEELARAKVAVNRVAAVVANEWKDESDKVIPMHQWLEERKKYQKEALSLKEKLLLAEKSIKYESQMKEKYQARLRILEESSRTGSSQRDIVRRFSMNESTFKSAKMSSSVEIVPGRSLGSSHSVDGVGNNGNNNLLPSAAESDSVSSHLYSLLEKEVVALRKDRLEKNQALNDKEDAIEMLSKKVEVLTKALENETKKAKREVVSLQKELSSLKSDPLNDVKKRLISPRHHPSASSAGSLFARNATSRSADRNVRDSSSSSSHG